MGPCKVDSWVPLQICIGGFTEDGKVHEATSASQWHGIAINGADPLLVSHQLGQMYHQLSF